MVTVFCPSSFVSVTYLQQAGSWLDEDRSKTFKSESEKEKGGKGRKRK
jgi:hypothetical protein